MVRTHPVSANSATGEGQWHVCPFCGAMNSKPGSACPRCTLEDTPAARSATKVRIGPWYVLQSRNPAAPGMKFQTLQLLVRKGFVTPQSVVRSPTTSQLWQSAAKVKGLSREFGLCYACGGEIGPCEALCPHCNRSQSLPSEVDALLDLPPGAEGRGEVAQEDNAERATPPAEAAPEEAASAEESIVAPSADVLSPRELAMVFQLGYDPPGTVMETPLVRNRRPRFYYIAVSSLSVMLIGIGLVCWWIRPGDSRERPVETAALTPAPTLPIHLVAVAAPAAITAAVVEKVAEPTAAAISTDDVAGLWNKAMDAESHRDFAAALKIYQRIEALPSEDWPQGLRTRIELARQEIKGGTY